MPGVNLLEPEVIGRTNENASVDFNTYINKAYPTFFTLVVFLGVIIIAWSGLKYMLSETPFGKKDAKNTMWVVIGGLLIALASILLLNTINPRIAETNPFPSSTAP